MALTVTPAELTATALTLTTAAQPNITSVGTLSSLSVGNITSTGTGTFAGGAANNNDDANILTLNASQHARLLVDTSSTGGHRATLALESNGNELTLATTGSASYLGSVGNLEISGGNVGIGVTSPGAILSLPAGESNTPRFAIESAVDDNDFTITQYEDGNGTYTILGQNVKLNSGGNNTVLDSAHRTAGIVLDARNHGAITFITGAANTATEHVKIDSSGKVGINNTSPDAMLHVKHAGGGFDEVARLTAVANSAGDGAFLGFHGNSTSKFYGFIGGYDIDTNKGGVKIGVGNGETAIADSMTKMTIDNTGITSFKPGIGDLSIKNNDSSPQSGIILEAVDANHAIYFRRGRDGTLNTMDFHEYDQFRFYTGGAIASQGERMRIQSDGTTFIDKGLYLDNYSTSDYRDGRPHTGLQGNGNQLRITGGGNTHVDISAVTSNSAYLTINAGESRLNNDAGYLAFGHNTNNSVPAFVAYIMHRSRGNTNQGYFDFYNRNSSGTAIHAARIDGDNANGLYSRTGSVTSLSDQRLKKNIQDLTYSMDEFKALKPRTFEWINPGDHPEGVQNGFVAQELPEHLKSTYDIGAKTGPLDEDVDPDYALVKDENGVGTAFGSSLGSNDAMYVSIIQQLIARIEALENN